MKFKNLTLYSIVFVITLVVLYYLILDMDGCIVYAEQIDQQIIQNDQSSDAEEELKKREEDIRERLKKVLSEDEIQREWDRMMINAAVSLALILSCHVLCWYFWKPV